MKHLPNIPILVRFSRESHYFDLGLEVGNIDGYCKAVLDFVIAAIAQDMFAAVHGSRINAWEYLHDYEEMIARFAYIVGRRLDTERISEDVWVVYESIRPVIDAHYPNWSYNCPGQFKVRITPGNFDFLVDI